MASKIQRWNGTAWVPILDGSTYASVGFSQVTAGSTTLTAATSTDTLILAAGTGIGITGVSKTATFVNSGVISVAGTTNQILVNGASAASSGTLTLSLPSAVVISGQLNSGNHFLNTTTYIADAVQVNNWVRPFDGTNFHLKAATGGMYFDADTHNFRSAAGAARVSITASGYIVGNYINMTADTLAAGTTPTKIAGQNGDNYMRWYNSIAGSQISGAISNVPSVTNTADYLTLDGLTSPHVRTANNKSFQSSGGYYGTANTTNGPQAVGGLGAALKTDQGTQFIHFHWTGSALQFYIDTSLVSTLGSGANITGSVAKAFTIQHPLDANRWLIHACSEGPTADVFYRGQGELVDGECIITLPDYFESIAELNGRTVQLTSIFEEGKETANLAASEVVNGTFKVIKAGGFIIEDQKFFWRVDAIRKNTDFPVEPLKSEVTIESFGPYTYIA